MGGLGFMERQPHERRGGRQQRQQIARQLVGGGREENHPEHHPCQQVEAPRVAVGRTPPQQKHKREPGQQQTGQHRQVEPPGLRVHQGTGCEPLEIMDQEKIVQKDLPIAEIAEQVPGKRHRQEGRGHPQPRQVARVAEAQA